MLWEIFESLENLESRLLWIHKNFQKHLKLSYWIGFEFENFQFGELSFGQKHWQNLPELASSRLNLDFSGKSKVTP